jgi:hypothetical protein
VWLIVAGKVVVFAFWGLSFPCKIDFGIPSNPAGVIPMLSMTLGRELHHHAISRDHARQLTRVMARKLARQRG